MNQAATLLIISAAFHALWNFALKRSTNKLGDGLAFMIIATLLNAIYGLASAALPTLNTELIIGTVAAGIFEGLYFYLLNTAYSKQALGVAYTIMRGGAMALVWTISILTLNETFDLIDGCAVIAIAIGIALVQRSFKIRDLFASGAYAAYACAGCIAGYHIGYGVAVQTGASPALVFASAMSIGIVTYITLSRGSALKELLSSLKQDGILVGAGGVACGVSFLLFLTALASVDPGRAISLRNTSVAFGALLSATSAEKLSATQWLGVSLVVAGALVMI
ncbi:MAG: EamA family transporter [Pseudomonadota bacterium]